jgi:outer membrane protein
MKNLLKVAALCGLSGLAAAQQAPDTSNSQAVAVPAERHWRLGAALGYGMRTNPLIQSDDIPVVVDLDIAWFGERWFFDNGDLGVELLDNQVMTTNLVARVNSDRAFFGKTNTRYVNFQFQSNGAQGALVDPTTGTPVPDPQQLKLPKRDYAIELGFETLFGGDWGQATLHAFHDVSDTHKGYEIAADYSYRFTHGRLSLSPMVGLSWKSDALSNYYWGVHPDEDSAALHVYRAKAGLGWEAGLKANYYLTRSVRLAVSANYERLQYSIAGSPLVERDYEVGYFAGKAWQF